MLFSVVLAAFVLILPVELPDKTLFATLLLATRFRPLPVFLGAGLAFGVQCVIAVAAGSLLTLLPDAVVRSVVAVLFIVGAVLLWREAYGGDDEEDEEAATTCETSSFVRSALVSFGVLFAAEWGDLSQLATAGLAARYDAPLSVFVGAWTALLLIAGLASFLGRKLADRLPIALLHRIGAAVFAVFAVIAAVEAVRAS